MYFILGYTFVAYGIFIADANKLFEIDYPAHPYVVEKRAEVVNAICYYYPPILKNEIEHLHQRIHNIQEGELPPEGNRYEKEFVTSNKNEKLRKRFKVIVEDGKVFLQCIDSFEDIFELSREIVEDLELTDILDPYLFDNHRDILNALFEVYYELANQYIQKYYFESTEIRDKAKEKVRKKFGLDE